MLNNFDGESHVELVKYSLALMTLERSLASRPDKLNELGAKISLIEAKHHLSSEHEKADISDTIADLADLYQSCLSDIEPGIKISGNKHHLQNPSNVQRVRALLLSGLRSAVLWHQLGGRRWQLIFSRSKMNQALRKIT